MKRFVVFLLIVVIIVSPTEGEGTSLFFVGNFGTEYSFLQIIP